MQNCDNPFRRAGPDAPRPVCPGRDHSVPKMNSDCAVTSSMESASVCRARCLNPSPSRSQARAWDEDVDRRGHSSRFRTMVVDSICDEIKREKKLPSRSKNECSIELRCTRKIDEDMKVHPKAVIWMKLCSHSLTHQPINPFFSNYLFNSFRIV